MWGHIEIEPVQWGRTEDPPVGYETTCFLAVMARMNPEATVALQALLLSLIRVAFFPDHLSVSVSCLPHQQRALWGRNCLSGLVASATMVS